MRKLLISLLFIAIFGVLIWVLFPTKLNQALNSSPKIGIQPFEDIDQKEIDSVKKAIETMYSFETVVLPKIDLPKMAFTTIRSPRYRADSLLYWLKQIQPDSIDITLGLTNKDISITKYKKGTREIKNPNWKYKDFGIFGLGTVGGEVCVVSSNRLHSSKSKFNKRLTRIACHEVGHVLGLFHCPNSKCLMNDANESIKTIDKSTGILCDDCINTIK